MPSQWLLAEQVRSSVRKGLDRGKTVLARPTPRGRNPHSWKSNFAGNCSSPITVLQTGRGTVLTKGGKSLHKVDVTDASTVLHELEVPCRQCENCLRRRAAHWRMRAIAETKAAPRTWFGTLTLSAEQHFRVAAACRLVAARNGDDFDTFGTERQFAARHKVISREITLFLNRLRKQCGAGIRFCCVAEAHKTGLPHYHMLVHESKDTPVTWRALNSQWRVGFSNWKLVENDTKPVHYVTKYLSKSSIARVRASLDYGNTTLSHSAPTKECA